jgi:glycosyltransferase 2 family protein
MSYLRKYKKHLLTGFIIGFIVIVALLIYADLTDVIRVLSGIDLRYVPLIVILAPLNYLFRFIKWNYYLNISGIAPEPRMNRYIFMSGLSMTITPAKVGELLKCYLLKEHAGAPVSKTSSIVMAERITDGISMVILATLGSLAYPYGKIVIPVAAALLLFFITAFHVEPLFKYISNLLLNIKFNFLKKSFVFLIDFQQSAKKLFSICNLLIAVLIGTISWGFEGLIVYLAVKALGGEISVLGSLFVVSLSALIGALSFIPGGLGITEGSIMTLLMLTGIGKEMAAATTVITRFSTLWLGVSVGVVGLILTNREFSRAGKKVAF